MIALILSLIYLGAVLVFCWWVFFREIPETKRRTREIEAQTAAIKERIEELRQHRMEGES